MNVLLIGAGGREHALAWKIAQSPKLSQLYTLPGNPGTAKLGINLPGNPEDLAFVVAIARQKKIDLVVVGPEAPLAAGLADALQEANISVYGPSKKAARIEADKAFAKDFMARHQIPAAGYRNFTDFDEALAYLKQLAVTSDPLPVIKAAGLAAGKGVILPDNLAEAETALREIMLEKRFGEAGAEVVIEARLVGREVTILAFSDGKTVVPMPPSQDHKRLLDNDQGPNTGGMGVFAPSAFAPPALVDWVVKHVIQPAVHGLGCEESPFIGTIYAGMILTDDGPKTLEFNCRFGDPETQVVLPLLDSDILEIFKACVAGNLDQIADSISWQDAATVCVVLASQGYPDPYPKGLPIKGLNTLPENVLAFHAGTADSQSGIVTHGGRVLGITATAASLAEARTLAYAGVKKINFEGMQYRTDIGRTTDSAYALSGVDIEAGNRSVALIKSVVQATHGPEVLAGVGSFGGLFSAEALKEMDHPVLVASTDGVGTKVMLAAQREHYAGIGKDIVNHCINDILVQGASPLFFMDYFASSKLDPEIVAEIVSGMAEACLEAGCALLGGETAEMPGVYHKGHFDVAGTIIGVVERAQVLPRRGIQPGDLLVGLASSGPHTNGYSLIRRVFEGVSLEHIYPELGQPLANFLLEPHRSYYSTLESALKAQIPKGLAHITGGGFIDNIPRILPPGCEAIIHRDSWTVPPLFKLIQELGQIDADEMYRVFNLGIGMVAVVAPEQLDIFQTTVAEQTWVIGKIAKGDGVVLV